MNIDPPLPEPRFKDLAHGGLLGESGWSAAQVLGYARLYASAKSEHRSTPAEQPAPTSDQEAALQALMDESQAMGNWQLPAPAEPYELTRSIIYKCPAIRLPQTVCERLRMMARIVVLKGASEAVAQHIVDALNGADPAGPAPAEQPHADPATEFAIDVLCRMNEAPSTHIRSSWKEEVRRAIVALRTGCTPGQPAPAESEAVGLPPKLTDEQIEDIADSEECNPDAGGWGPKFDFILFARAIEADLAQHPKDDQAALRGNAGAMREALVDLVDLKYLKDMIDMAGPLCGGRPPGTVLEDMTAEYNRRKPLVWSAARAALADTQPSSHGSELTLSNGAASAQEQEGKA